MNVIIEPDNLPEKRPLLAPLPASHATCPLFTERLITQFAAGKLDPPMTNRENHAINDNPADPSTPELDTHATKCDTSAQISQTSHREPNATKCDTIDQFPQTSHSNPNRGWQ